MSTQKPAESEEVRAARARLNRLVEEEEHLRFERSNLNRRIKAAQEEVIWLEWGVKAGSVVRHQGRRFRVTGIENLWYGGKPWLKGNPTKKDGDWSKVNQYIGDDWHVVEEDETEEDKA